MKIGIVGSRGYTDLERVRRYVLSLQAGDVVVSGGARGVDTAAFTAALERDDLGAEEIRPDLTAQPVFALAAKARNRAIVEASHEIVAFWDGESPGTANTIAWAVALGKPVRVIL